MVAVVAGNGLGLGNTSFGKLGQAWGGQADIGQAGVGQYVNVANGNLVIRDPGQALVFDGTSFNPLGTYNSQGQLQGGHGWVFGFDRSVGGLTGDLDSQGSTVTRTAEDGSTVTYAYDSASGDYLSQDAAGTQDRLHWDATSTSWRWTDGATQANESYDASGRLTGLSNPATGASFTLTWQDGHVASVTAGDGDSLVLSYDTSGHLSTLSISEVPPGGGAAVVRQESGYAYDGLGRLVSVTTNLASDTATAAASYTTTFTYDGDSDRLASMTQGDGTSVAYVYGQDATGSWRVSRITTGTGDDARSIGLSYGASATSVTDASGDTWTYGYSADGSLTSVTEPATHGSSPRTTYAYDAEGNLTSLTDPNGGLATYRYDARGNLLSAIDASGTTVTYQYDANNRMVSQSRYTVAAKGHERDTDFIPATGAETTRYVYDGAGRLVYRIDPAGAVTRQDWTTQADGTSVLGSTYAWNGATFAVGQDEPTVSELASWESASTAVLAQGQRSDFTYDIRGQLTTRTDYASLDASGQGILDAAASVTRTTYDAFGRLLQSATVRGAGRDTLETRSYAYDGMGRTVSSTDSLGHTTSYIYLDNHNTVEIIDAGGLTTLQVRNSAGALVSSTQSAGKPPLAGQVFYDAQGHIIAANDALGDTVFLFYDAAGHNIATVEPGGHLTLSTYDASGNLLSTLQYGQTIDTAGWLTDTGPTALMPSIPTPPARSPNDLVTLSVYDTAGRVIATVGAQGVVTMTHRDATGNAIGTVTYATPLDATQVQALGTSPSLADVQAAVVPTPGSDQITTAVFDGQGRELAGIDASGIVTVMTYDGSGRLVHRLTYAQALTADQRASLGDTPTMDDVQALTTRQPNVDTQAFWFYDAAGHLVGSVDASGKADIYTYTGDHLTSTLERGQPLDGYTVENFASAPSLAALSSLITSSADQLSGTLTLYDASGHVAATVTDGGVATRYTLDANGHVVATRTVLIEQPAAIASLLQTPTLATLDAILNGGYDQGTQLSVYDDTGRLAATIDPNGYVTLLYYDTAGRLVAKAQSEHELSSDDRTSLGGAPRLADLHAIIDSSAADGTELHYFDDQGREVASVVNAQLTVHTTDAAGRPTADVTYANGIYLGAISRNGQLTLPALADLTANAYNSQYDTRTYHFYDDQGQPRVDITSDRTYSSWDGYVMEADITYHYTSQDGKVSEQVIRQQALSAEQFQDFASNPTLDHLATFSLQGWTPTPSVTVRDDSGRITLTQTPANGLTTFDYDDANGIVVERKWRYDPLSLATDGSVPDASDIAAMLPDPASAQTTVIHATRSDDAGAATYDISTDGTVDITRRNLAGAVIATLHYGNVSWDDIQTLAAEPSQAGVDALLGTLQRPDSVSVFDGAGNALAVFDGTSLTVTSRDASGGVLGQTRYANVPTAAQLQAVAANGDVSTLVASMLPSSGDVRTLSVRDAGGNLLASIDLAGQVTTYRYDASGRLLLAVHHAHQLTVAERNTLGGTPTLSAVEAVAGTSVNDTSVLTMRDPSGRLLASTTSDGYITFYTYDDQGRQVASAINNTRVTTRQLLELSDAPSLAALRFDIAMDNGDTLSQNLYDSAGRLVATIATDGTVVTQSYDAAGNVTLVRTYANRLQPGFGFIPTLDALHAELHGTTADNVQRTVYDQAGRIVAAIDGVGNLSITTYRLDGTSTLAVYAVRLTAAQMGSLGVAPSLAQVMRLVSGRTSADYFDPNGRRVASVDPAGVPTYYFYDASGRLSAQVDASGAATSISYDVAGNVASTTAYATAMDVSSWLNGTTGMPYPPASFTAPASNNDDRTSYMIHDAAGRTLASIDPTGTVTTFVYDGQGRIVATTVHATRASASSLAAHAVPITMQDVAAWVPDSTDDRTTRSIWDDAGNVSARIDGDGYVTAYTYDALHNVTATHRYATKLDTSALASLDADPCEPTLAGLLSSSQGDLLTRSFHDGLGRTTATIDEAGYLTTYTFDEQTHTTTTTRYAVALAADVVAGLADSERADDLVALLPSTAGAQAIRDRFDGEGELVDHVDATGADTTYSYDADGRQVAWATTDAWNTYSGKTAYDVFGDVVSRTTGTGDVTSSVWNASGQLESTTDAAGNITRYYYDGVGRLSARLDGGDDTTGRRNGLGAVTTYSYTIFGQLETTTQYGHLLTLGDDGLDPLSADASSVIKAIDATGQDGQTSITRAYDAAGRLSATTDGDGYTTRYTYDAFGELASTTQAVSAATTDLPNGLSTTTTYAYDARGERVSLTQAAGTSSARAATSTYDAFGRPVTTTDGMGHVTSYSYDRLGRKIAVADAVNGQLRQSSTTYDAFDRVVSQVDAQGNATTFAYDTANNAVTVTTPEGVRMTTVHDALGDVVSVTDGAGAVTRYAYDAAGRLVERTDALGNADSYAYQDGGRVVQQTGADGTIATTYDAQGKVLSRSVGTDAVQTTRYSYDGAGRVITQTSPGGGRTFFVYDGAGNLITKSDDTGVQTTYTYDGEGRQVTVTSGLGTEAVTTRYAYDDLGRLAATTVDPDGLALTTTFRYDSDDNLVQSTDPRGLSTWYIRDEAGRALYTFTPVGDVGAHTALVTRSTYDLDGRLVSSSVGSSAVATGELDSLASGTTAGNLVLGGRLATLSVGDSDRTTSTILDADGRKRFAVDADGLVTEWRYDALGRVSAVLVYTAPVDRSGALGAALMAGTATIADMSTALSAAGLTAGQSHAQYAYYDANGNVLYSVSATESSGQRLYRVTGTTYNPDGQVATSTLYATGLDQADFDQATSSDALASILARTQDAGSTRTTTYLYTADHRQAASVGPDGAASFSVYDTTGNLIETVDPAGTATTIVYDDMGRVTGRTVHSNLMDNSDWIANGQLTDRYGQLPYDVGFDQRTDTTYDSAGRVSSIYAYSGGYSTGGAATLYHYDAAGRIEAVDVVAFDAANPPPSFARAMSTPDTGGGYEYGEIRTTRYERDADGNIIAQLDPLGILTTYQVDAEGRALASTTYATPVADRTAALSTQVPAASAGDRTTLWFRDTHGDVTASIDASGYLTRFSYDTSGRQTGSTRYATALPASARVDEATALAAAEGSASRSTSTTYDAQGRVSATVDAEGSVTTYTYDLDGHVLTTVTAAGKSDARQVTSVYNALGQAVQTTDAAGATTTFTYDVNGRLATTADALGNLTWHVYDADGREIYTIVGMAGEDGSRNGFGAVTERDYDAFGDVSTRVNYAQYVPIDSGFSPDPASIRNLLSNLSYTGDSNQSTSYNYDARGHVLQTGNDDGDIQYTYDAFGELVQRQDERNGNHPLTTNFAYDADGHLVSQEDAEISGSISSSGGFGAPLSASQSWTYDAFGDVASYTDADGSVVSYTYDAIGERTSTSQAVGGSIRAQSTSYDAYGRIAAQTDALGLTTTFAYDDTARSVTSHLPGGLSTTAVHDRFGKTVSLTDAAGATTLYGYDAAGRLRTTTRPDGLVSTSTYDVLGNMTSTTDAQGHVVNYTYDARGQVLTQDVDPDGLNLVTTYAYDGAGLKIKVTDPVGNVQLITYTGAGEVSSSEVDDANGTMVSQKTFYYSGGHATQISTASPNGYAYNYDSYDAFGRLSTSDSKAFGVTSYTYDSKGNLIQSAVDGVSTYYFYDEAGELTYKVSPSNGSSQYSEYGVAQGPVMDSITAYTYDKDGNVLSTTQYARTIENDQLNLGNGSGGGGPSEVSTLAQVARLLPMISPSADDRSSYNVYDDAGRLAYQVDTSGNVTETRYDAAGRVSSTARYPHGLTIDASLADKLRNGTESAADMSARVAAAGNDEASSRETRTYYDAMGRVAFSVQEATAEGTRSGRVTEMRYDMDGRLVSTVVHDDLLAAGTLDSMDTAALAAWAMTSTSGLSTQVAYDAAGRPTWQISADGMATQTSYDGNGRVVASTVYAHPLASTGDGSESAIAASVALANPDPSDARTTRKVYDALGNVLQVFAPGDTVASATYTYDARNTPASYTNALGLTWNYQYQNGFLVSESTPSYAQVDDGGYGSGSIQNSTAPLTTNYNLDGAGRITSQGTPNSSSAGEIYYQRDAAGNIVSTYTDSTTVFDPSQGAVVNSYNQGYSQATYDAFGEQVVYTDAQGATSYKVFDTSGRLAYDIDASGHVTAYAYDGYGEVSSVVRYAQPLALSSIAGWTPGTPLDTAQVSGALVTDAGDRQVVTTYDGFGRKTEVRQNAVAYATADGSSGVASPTTRYRYDVRGNLIATEVLVSGDASQSTATWAISRSYYDDAGRQVMTVDPMGYVSTWAYGDFGQLLTQTDYATPVAMQAFAGSDAPPALPAASDTDRSTSYTYDAQGRKLTESTLRDYVDVQGQPVHGFVTTTYGYDAAGQVTSVSEGGRTILTTYDEAGHIHSVTAPPERVLVSNWKELLAANPTWDLTNDALYVTASQVVTYGYDGAGWKTVETHSSTAGGASLSTWYRYDRSGRQLASVTSVNGAPPDWTSSRVVYNVYDLDGRVTQTVSQQTDTGFSGVAVTINKAYTYDALGNVVDTSVSRLGVTTPDTESTSAYNGFGEVASTGNGVATRSTSTYDAAGRLATWTDPATGVLHTYSYDLAGQLVRDDTLATGGVEVHIAYTRDLDGHVLSQVAPSTTDTTGEGAARQATYDRWGNILSSTDAEGNTTTYTYNERNQLVSTRGPQVTVVDAAGNASTTTPVKTTAYDMDGNVVAVTDEDGNTVSTVHDGAGQVVDVIDGAGSHTRVAYDALGNEVGGQTGLDNGSESSLHITFKEVDGQGHVVDEGDFFNDGTGYKATLRQVYVLDEAGNRVAVFDGLGSAALQAGDQATANRHATYYSYDSQGRVIASQNGAQRDFSHVNPANYPAPVQQPRNLDLASGDVAWSTDPADQAGGWTYTNGTYVYAGGTDDTIHLVNQDRVPVTAGQQITAWADLESDGDHGGSGVDIVWYDANDQLISRSGGNIQTTDDGRGRSTVTGTAPSGAAYARIDVGASNHGNSDNTTTFYGAGWDYTPPDGGLSPILDGSIFVNLPTTTFSMQPLNPDFENGASGWDLTAGWSIVQADNTANGKWVATYTGTTVGTLVNNNRAPVVPGQKITAKARITLDQHNDGKPAGALLILWYDKDGNLVRYNSSSVITNGHDGTFQDVSVTDVAPEGAAYATVAFSGNGDGTGFAVFDAVSWDYHYVPTLNVGASVNTFTYDRDGNLTAQTNADGDTESWIRDSYGRITDHTDLSGASYHYTYDASSGLQLSESDNWAAGALADVTAPGYVHGANGTGNSESRSYNAAGQLIGLTYGDGSAYSYAYDANGNQVRQEATTVDGNGKAVHTVTTTGYDSHGRIAQVSSDDGTDVLTETYAYDAAGNRRSIVATVTAGGVQKSSTTSWYDYDGDNRVAVSDGDMVNGAITVSSRSTSYGSSYDAAGNLTVRTTNSGGTFLAQRNVYDARGELTRADYASALSDPNAWRGIAETRTYDANGNVITDAQYYTKGTTATKAYNPKLDPDSPSYIGDGAGQTPGADISGYLSTATITRYDSYGRVAAEQTFGHGQNWSGAGGETTPDALPADGATSWSGMDLQSAVLYQGPGNSAGYDAMGNVVFYQYRANSARLDQYTVTYLKKEGYLESSTSGQNITNLANVRPTTDESYYNVRGERIAIAQHTQYAYGTVADTVRAFAYDGNGQIIARRDGTAKDDAIDQGTDPTLKNQHYVYVNGQQVAHYDEHSTVDVLSEVTAFSSGNGTGNYVVQDGDTLKSIAQAVYGNASLWYIVAQANALGGDADLAAGLSLTIPAVTTTKNDATTFKPYNPSEIQGSTMPNLPVIAPPPPPPKQHCNVIAAVIVIAVVVVASVFTFGAAAAALGDIGAAALAGAAGSAAGQLAGDALGTHQGFSLGEVFTSAATAVVTAGVGQYLSNTNEVTGAAQAGDSASTATATTGTLSFTGRAVQAAAGYVAQDAAGKLVGQQEHFSWAGLVSNSLAAGIGGEFGPTPQQIQTGLVNGSALQVGAGTLVAGVVQRETSLALGDNHVPSLANIGEQVVGNYLGAALGSRLGGGSDASFDQDALEQRVNGGIVAEQARLGDDIEGNTSASLQGYFAATNGQAANALDGALDQTALTTSVGVPGTNFGVASGSAYLGADISRPDTSLNRYLVDPNSQEYWGGNGHASAGDFYATTGDPEKPSNRIDFSKFPVDNRPVARSLPPITGVTSAIPDIGEPDATFQVDEPSFDTSFVTQAPDLTTDGSTSPEYNAFLGGAARAAGSLAGIGESVYDVARGLTNVGGALGSAYAERIAGRGGVSDTLFNVHTDAFEGAADRLGGGIAQLGSAVGAFAQHPIDQTASYLGRLKGDLDHAAALSDSTNYADQFDSGRAFGTLAGEVAMDIDGGTALAKAGIGVGRLAGSFTAEALSTMTYSRSTGVTFEAGSGRFALRSPFYALEGFTPTSINTPVVPPVGVRSPVVRLADDVQSGSVIDPAPTATQLRNMPGIATVSSDLEPTSGYWLDAAKPTPIPAQVGEALVGRQFSTFADLRSAIWENIGSNPDLTAVFSRQNIAQMKNGFAPFAPSEYLNESGAFGQSFNLHHELSISEGGSVYDLSNLQIVSPRTHHGIHYGSGP